MKIEEYMQGKWKQATCTQTSNTSNTEDLQKPTKLADLVAWQLRTYVFHSKLLLGRHPLKLNAIVPRIHRSSKLQIHHRGVSTTPSGPDPNHMRKHGRVLQVMAA